jgi:hypothetical protein
MQQENWFACPFDVLGVFSSHHTDLSLIHAHLAYVCLQKGFFLVIIKKFGISKAYILVYFILPYFFTSIFDKK